MKKSTKKFTSTFLAAASVAGIVVPATQAFAAEKMTLEKAKELIAYANQKKNFAAFNIAYAAILELKLDEAKQNELLAQLPAWKDVVTPDVQKALDYINIVAKNLELKDYDEAEAYMRENIKDEENKAYLLGAELTVWGKKGVYTEDVTAAVDAILKVWADKTEAAEKAAQEAIAKVKKANNVTYLQEQLKEASDVVVRTLKAEKIEAVGAKKIKVTYNKAVDTAKANVALYKGIAPVATSSIAWNEAKTEATITTIINLTAGDYTVKTTGLADTVADAKVTVEAERITDISIISGQLQKIATAPVSYVVKNQYGEEKTMTAADLTVSAIYAKTGNQLTAGIGADGKFTVDATSVAIGDNVVVTITYKNSGLTKSVTVPVVAASKVGTVSVSEPVLPTGTTRLSINNTTDTVKIPYVAKDQYGNAVKLTANQAGSAAISAADGLTIISSDSLIIDPATIKVNANSELTFRTGAKAGTVMLTFVLPATGESTTLSVTVNDVAGVNSFNMIQPTNLVNATKAVNVDYLAADQYGSTYAKKDFLVAQQSKLTFISSNTAIVNPSTDIGFNAKNELVITPQTKGVVNVTVYLNGVAQNTITLDVQEAIVPTKVVGVKNINLATLESGEIDVKTSNLSIVDQFGRDVVLSGNWTAKLELKDKTETSLDLGDQTDYSNDGTTAVALAKDDTTYAKLKGKSTIGSETIVVTLVNNGTAVTTSSYEFNVNTIKASDVTAYEFATLPLLHANAAAKAISVIGKDAAGQKVALPAGHITLVTSDNPLITVAGMNVTAAKAATATLSAWIGSNKVATATITSSEETPVVKTLTFGKDSYEVQGAANTTSTAVATDLTKKDQYGNLIVDNGYWTTSDATIATINPTTGLITLKASGVVTITYIASNGVPVSTQVTVVVTP